MMTEMKTNNGKRLIAAVAILAMLVCALAIAMPASDAADTETTSGVITAADTYQYEGDAAYEYVGDRTIDGNDVLMTYSGAYDESLMNDFARFMGAIYRANESTVASVTYNNTVYTWDADGTLKGSNWVDAEGKTLVSVVVANALAGGSLSGSYDFTITLKDATKVDMSYGIAAPVASIGESTGIVYYGTLKGAIEAADKDDVITLLDDITGNVTIPVDKTIVLDLAGNSITYKNTASNPKSTAEDESNAEGATILVKGALTINDSVGGGSVIQQGTNAAAAVHVSVGGSLTVNGGHFDSTEISTSGYYTMKNLGTVVINGGTFNCNSGKNSGTDGSSVIANGWYTTSNNTGKSTATMTINAGTFTGNHYVKNDEYGVMNIYGGTFSGTARGAAILNWNVLTIDDDADDTAPVVINSLKSTDSAVLNGYYNEESCKGILNIESGTFNVGSLFGIGVDGGGVSYHFGTVSIAEGISATALSTANRTLNGTLSIGDNTATFEDVKVKTLTLKEGSIIISGTIDAGTYNAEITAEGDIVIDRVTITSENANNYGLTITGDGDGVTIGNLTVEEGTNLVVKTPVTITGTVASNDNVYFARNVTGEEGSKITGAYSIASDATIGGVDLKDATGTTDYDLLQNGTITTGENWTYDKDNNVLTLKGGEIIGSFVVPNNSSHILTVNIEKDTTIINDGVCIDAKNSIEFTGNGCLTIIDDSDDANVGISSTGYITFNADVDASGLTMNVGSTVTVNKNLTVGSITNDLTVGSAGTVMVENLTTTASYSNSGIILVTGTINVAGVSSTLLIQTGLSAVPEAGCLYFTGSPSNIKGTNFSTTVAPGAIDSDAVVSNQISDIGNGDIVILAINAVLTGQTIEDNVTIAGTVSGEVTVTTGTLTVGAANGLKVNGVTVTSTKTLTITSDSYNNAVIDGTVNALTVPEGETVTVIGTIDGTVTGGTDETASEVKFYKVTSTTGIAITGGSVEIAGDFVLNGDNGETAAISGDVGDLVINGDSEITGKGTIAVKNLTIGTGATLTIGANVVIVLDGSTNVNSQLVIEQDAVLTGDGYILLKNSSTGITNNGTLDVQVKIDEETTGESITVSNAAEFVNALPYYTNIEIDDVIDFLDNDGKIIADFTKSPITVTNKVITITANGGFSIPEGVTVNFVGTTVYGEDAESFYVGPKGTLGIDDSDIYANVEMDDDAILNRANYITNIDGSSIYLSSVGFGKVINFNNNYNLGSGSVFAVYGELNVAEGYTLTVGNATLNIKKSGELNVAGTFNVTGTLNVYGTVTVTGTMSMAGKLTIYNEADFGVAGTLDVTGTMAGAVSVTGTVDFAGTVTDEITVGMYDGATLNVESMTGTGTITVNGIASFKDPYADLNVDEIPNSYVYPVIGTSSISLTAVNGVSITATETVTSQKIPANATYDAGKNQDVYIVTLDISGSAVANSSVTGDASETTLVNADIGFAVSGQDLNGNSIADLVKTGAVTVKDTLDLGDKVVLTFDENEYTVDGTINAAKGASITNNGTITVAGKITVIGSSANTAVINGGTVNAAYYNETTPAVAGVSALYVTKTYTSLAAAVGVTTADKDTIYVSGTLTVAEGETVEVPATLKVDYANTTYDSKLVIDGTLVFADYENSCMNKNVHIYADVMFEEKPMRTYTSLANAIDMGVTEIELNQTAQIYEDLTIPAGVTVFSDKYGVEVNSTSKDGTKHSNVTLTVEGALELTGTQTQDVSVAGIALNSYNDPTVVAEKKDYRYAYLVLSGTGYVYLNPDNNVNGSDYLEDSVSGAYYQMEVQLDPESTNKTTVDVIATVDRAAADSANVLTDADNNATITIRGIVTTLNDLVFNAPEDATLAVIVECDSDTTGDVYDLVTKFTAPSVTLGENVTFETDDAAGTETYAAVTVDTVVAFGFSSVDFDKVVGEIGVGCIENEEDGTVYDVMYLYVTAGTVTVEAGQVNIEGTVAGGTDKKAGAELIVAAGATAVIGNEDLGAPDLDVGQYATLTVEGTLNVYNTGSTIDVYGTMDVSGTVGVLGTLTIDATDGKLNVVDGSVATLVDDAGKTGTITVNGIAIVGEKPTEVGQVSAGSLVGATAVGDGYVKAYNGANVKMATDDGDALSQSTAFNIRAQGGEYFTYMTVYVALNNDQVDVFGDIVYNETFALTGYDTGLLFNKTAPAQGVEDKNTGLYKIANWYTSADRVANTALTMDEAVGAEGCTALYAEVMPVKVDITVSAGTGLNLYIDGIATGNGTVSLAIGTHTVRFDVSANYDGSKAVITFAGQTVSNGGTFEVTVDSDGAILSATGATPSQGGEIVVNPPEVVVNNQSNDDMALTDILLIVLVILIVIMAIIVALRMMRS